MGGLVRARRGGVADLRADMLHAPARLETRDQFAAAITQGWSRAFEAALQVGRFLIQAKERLPHGEFETMVDHDLPFTASTAFRLREAAALVDSGAVPPALLPPVWSTVAELAKLEPAEREAAVAAGVIRPEMRRRDLVQWLSTVRPGRGGPPAGAHGGAAPGTARRHSGLGRGLAEILPPERPPARATGSSARPSARDELADLLRQRDELDRRIEALRREVGDTVIDVFAGRGRGR